MYALGQLAGDGHCFALLDQLAQETAQLLSIQSNSVYEQVDFFVRSGELISEDKAIYLPPFYLCRTGRGEPSSPHPIITTGPFGQF